jgi:hypothetical protein
VLIVRRMLAIFDARPNLRYAIWRYANRHTPHLPIASLVGAYRILSMMIAAGRIEGRLSGYDACFFCLGVSSVWMKEETYRRVTPDLTVSVAKTLAKLNPTMTFIYVSGAGTDHTERGQRRWARVKGRTENTLLEIPFKAVYLFRPAYIQPLHGVRTKTAWYGGYGALYAVIRPFYRSIRYEDAFPELRDND